jgi:hypothetical protein
VDNGKISLVQWRRISFFQILGLGLLVLPEALAQESMEGGGFSLMVAVVLGILYVYLAGRFRDRKPMVLLNLWKGAYLLLLGGYETYLLAQLAVEYLLPRESIPGIGVAIVLLAAYSCKGGPEGLTRTFEILFWPVVALLILWLVLGIREMDPGRLFPMKNMAEGIPLSCFVLAIPLLLPEPGVAADGTKKIPWFREYVKILLAGGGTLILFYEVLLGSFGAEALADSRIPVMVFSGNLVLPGGFLRRQEALVAGVCFLGAMALVSSCLWGSCQCLGFWGRRKLAACLLPVAMYAGCLWAYYSSTQETNLQQILLWLLPGLLLLPFLASDSKPSQPKKVIHRAVLLLLPVGVSLFCSGCSFQDLEDKSFPMVIALGKETGQCTLTYGFMDLSLVSEKEQTRSGSDDLQVRSATLQGAMCRMDQKNGKIMDLSHAKVLLLETDFLQDRDLVEQLLQESNREGTLSGNLLVLVTEDMDDIMELQQQMDADLGSYLEELFCGNSRYKNDACFALKYWISDWYQRDTLSILPKIVVEDDLPVQQGYYGYFYGSDGQVTITELSDLQGQCSILCQKQIRQLNLMDEEGTVQLTNLSVDYDFAASDTGIISHITVTGELSAGQSREDPVAKKVEEQISSVFLDAWEQGIDLSNSYQKISSKNPGLLKAFAGDWCQYWQVAELQVDTDFIIVP